MTLLSCQHCGRAHDERIHGADEVASTAAAPLPTAHEYSYVSVSSVYLYLDTPPFRASIAVTKCSCGLVHSGIAVKGDESDGFALVELGRELERIGATRVPLSP